MLHVSQFSVFENYGDSTIAFNTLTKEFLCLEMDYKSFQIGLESDTLPEDIKEKLSAGSFLVSDGHDEYDDFLLSYRNVRYGSQNLVVYITPTLKCNAACEYCFQRDIRPGLPHSEGPKPEKIIMFIASKIKDAMGLKITWFGGEPLLKSKYIDHMSKNLISLAEMAKKPYSASMVTNGMFLDEDRINMLLRSKIYRLQISLDGSEEVHNSIGRKDGTRGYREIINNVKNLPDQIKVSLRVNVSRKNVATIPDLLDDLVANGLNKPNINIHFPLVYDYSIDSSISNYSDPENYMIPNRLFGEAQLHLEAYAKKLGFYIDMDDILIAGQPLCHAIKSKGYSIWPDGSITRCIHEVDTPENLNIEDEFSNADKTPSLQKWTMAEVFSTGPCRKCFYLPICGGSCVHERFQGVEPPISCPPSKWTLRDRMRWYEAAAEGKLPPFQIDREQLMKELSTLSQMSPKEELLQIKSFQSPRNIQTTP